MKQRKSTNGKNPKKTDDVRPDKEREAKTKPSFKVEQLEPRILLSATWVDADTGDALDGPTDGDDAFFGTDANDYARGNDGDDIFAGNDGDDSLFGDDGDDILNGGNGNDRLYGGAGADQLNGGAGNDVLYADEHDTIDGGDGYDYVRADSGSQGPANIDMAASNVENIDLHNTSSDHNIDASNSQDSVWARGGTGNDTITGGSGDDSLYGHDGDDVIIGDAGERVNVGNLGASVTASDQLTGDGYIMYSAQNVHDRFGNDHPLHAQNADHFVTVVKIGEKWYFDDNSAHGSGADPAKALHEFTPSDSDLIVAAVNFDHDTVTDLRGTSGDIDGIESGYAGGDITFTANRHGSQHNPGEVQMAGEFFVRNGSGEGSNDRLYGGAGADTLIGGGGNDVLYADDADTVDGGEGYDYLRADSGSDGPSNVDMAASNIENVDLHNTSGDKNISASGKTDNVWARGGTGNDRVTGGSGDDSLYGHDGDDVIEGGDGNDRLYGGAGADDLSGGAGNDVLYADDADTVDGGEGYDYLRADSGSDGPSNVDMAASNIENVDLHNTSGDKNISASGKTDNVWARGGTGDDRIVGGSGDDSLYGHDGDDVIEGDGGPNLIINGSFEDLAGTTKTGWGHQTNQTSGWKLEAGNKLEIVDSGHGGVQSSDGDHWLDLDESPGNITVSQQVAGVEEGAKYELSFDLANRARNSSGGIEVYWNGELLASLQAKGTAMERHAFEVVGGSGDGSDKLTFKGTGNADNVGASLDNVSLVKGGNDRLYGGAGADTLRGGGGNDVIYADDADTVDGGTGYDYLRADSGSDGPSNVDMAASNIENVDLHNTSGDKNISASGKTDNVWARGGTGNDRVTGGSGDDSLYGHDGDDVIEGGAGNDRLFGGAGADTLSGGAGNDVIYADGDDTVDGGDGYDYLRADSGFSGSMDVDMASSSIENVDLHNTSGDHNIDASGKADNVWARGGSGDDRISGGSGSDSLYGHDGDDVIRGGAGNDRIDGGEGNDTVVLEGDFEDYEITRNSNGSVTVRDLRVDGSGVDTIYNIENFEFADQSITAHALFNEAPTDIHLDASSVVENAAPGTVVAHASVSDADVNESFSFKLTNDADGRFTVDENGAIVVAEGADLNFEAANSHEITLEVTDSHGATYTESFTIGVENANDTPEAIEFSAAVETNSTVKVRLGGEWGNSAGQDAAPPRYEIFADGEKIGEGVVDWSSLERFGAQDSEARWQEVELNIDGSMPPKNVSVRFINDAYEGKSETDRNMYVDAIEVNGQRFEAEGEGVNFNRGNLNSASDDIAGQEGMYWGGQLEFNTSNAPRVASIAENAAGAVVGSVRVVDADVDDSHAFSISDERFEVVNGQLKLKDGIQLNFEAESSVDLTVGVTDSAGATHEQRFRISVLDVNENFRGTSDADEIDGTSGDDNVRSRGGDDVIHAGDGDDFVAAGSGDDDIFGGAGDDDLRGQAGDDVIDGGEGDDRLIGGAGDDQLSGDEGNDRINGGAGNDRIDGGTGNDRINAGGGDDVVNAGDGDDFVAGGAGDDDIFGGAGDDDLRGQAGDDVIDGGDGDDRLIGGAGNDQLSGGEGNDTINGGAGSDQIDGGAGNDRINAGGDDDIVNAGDGDDFVAGGAGNDRITGDAGNDDLRGQAGDDVIDGGDGDDRLIGGAGNDQLIGGAGNDVLNGGAGNDLIDAGSGNDRVNAGDGDDVISAGDGDDFVAGGKGNDTILGGAGNDDLRGQAGDDIIDGGAGDDRLLGGDGDDRLIGGAGNDFIRGDNGNDTVVYSGERSDYTIQKNKDGSVTITDNREGSPDGTDRVKSVENFEFTDGVRSFDQLFNVAPESVALSNTQIPEDAPAGTVVGTLSAVDADTNESATFEITGGAVDVFELDGDQIKLRDGVQLDYESTSSYDVEITATDSAGDSVTKTLTIDVGNVNEGIDAVSIDANVVAENAGPGTVVGTIAVSDPDFGDDHSFELTDDADGRFVIDAESGVVRVADGADLNFENASEHEISVRVVDSAGNERIETLSIIVEDVNEAPTDFSFTPPVVVNSDMPNGSEVTRISGNDVDANDVLQYQLLNDCDGAFQIDAETGIVSIADASKLGDNNGSDMMIVAQMTDSAGNNTQVELIVPLGSTSSPDVEIIEDSSTQTVDQSAENVDTNSDEQGVDDVFPSQQSPEAEIEFGLESSNDNAPVEDGLSRDRDNRGDTDTQARDVDEIESHTVIRRDAEAGTSVQARSASIEIDSNYQGQSDAAQREAGYNYIVNKNRGDGSQADGHNDNRNDRDEARPSSNRVREFVGRGGLPKLVELDRHIPSVVEQAGVDVALSASDAEVSEQQSGRTEDDRNRARHVAAEPLDLGLSRQSDNADESAFVEEAAQELADQPVGFVAGLWALLRGKAGLGKTEDEMLAANQKREALGRKK